MGSGPVDAEAAATDGFGVGFLAGAGLLLVAAFLALALPGRRPVAIPAGQVRVHRCGADARHQAKALVPVTCATAEWCLLGPSRSFSTSQGFSPQAVDGTAAGDPFGATR